MSIIDKTVQYIINKQPDPFKRNPLIFHYSKKIKINKCRPV